MNYKSDNTLAIALIGMAVILDITYFLLNRPSHTFPDMLMSSGLTLIIRKQFPRE